jgi:hypothetical protein
MIKLFFSWHDKQHNSEAPVLFYGLFFIKSVLNISDTNMATEKYSVVLGYSCPAPTITPVN